MAGLQSEIQGLRGQLSQTERKAKSDLEMQKAALAQAQDAVMKELSSKWEMQRKEEMRKEAEAKAAIEADLRRAESEAKAALEAVTALECKVCCCVHPSEHRNTAPPQ